MDTGSCRLIVPPRDGVGVGRGSMAETRLVPAAAAKRFLAQERVEEPVVQALALVPSSVEIVAGGVWSDRLSVARRWTHDEGRAPHKPLLLLCVLGRLQRAASSATPFAEAEDDLQHLLDEFGPPGRSSPPYPPLPSPSDRRLLVGHD